MQYQSLDWIPKEQRAIFVIHSEDDILKYMRSFSDTLLSAIDSMKTRLSTIDSEIEHCNGGVEIINNEIRSLGQKQTVIHRIETSNYDTQRSKGDSYQSVFLPKEMCDYSSILQGTDEEIIEAAARVTIHTENERALMSNTVYRTLRSLEQVDSSSRDQGRVVTSMAPRPTRPPISQDTVKSSIPPPLPQAAIRPTNDQDTSNSLGSQEAEDYSAPQDMVKSSIPPPLPQVAVGVSSTPEAAEPSPSQDTIKSSIPPPIPPAASRSSRDPSRPSIPPPVPEFNVKLPVSRDSMQSTTSQEAVRSSIPPPASKPPVSQEEAAEPAASQTMVDSTSQDTIKSTAPPPLPPPAPRPTSRDASRPSIPPPPPQFASRSPPSQGKHRASLPPPMPSEKPKSRSFSLQASREGVYQPPTSPSSDASSPSVRSSPSNSLLEEIRAAGGRVRMSEQETRKTRMPPPLPQSAIPTLRRKGEEEPSETQTARSLPASLSSAVSASHAIKPVEAHQRTEPPPAPTASVPKGHNTNAMRASAPVERVPPPPPPSAPPIRSSLPTAPPPPPTPPPQHGLPPSPAPPPTPPPQRGLPPSPAPPPPPPSSAPPMRSSLHSAPPPVPPSAPPQRSTGSGTVGSSRGSTPRIEESRGFSGHDDKTKLFGKDTHKTGTLKEKRKELGKAMLSCCV